MPEEHHKESAVTPLPLRDDGFTPLNVVLLLGEPKKCLVMDTAPATVAHWDVASATTELHTRVLIRVLDELIDVQ